MDVQVRREEDDGVASDRIHAVRDFELTAQATAVERGDILIRRMQYHAGLAWMPRSDLPRVEEKSKAA